MSVQSVTEQSAAMRARTVQVLQAMNAPQVTPARTWRKVDIGPVSKAGGEFPVDWARAHADAKRVLDSIDFSKRQIVIWIPGTSNKGVHPDFEEAVRAGWGSGPSGEGAALTALVYEATWNLRPSLATGIATLRLVLDAIKARGGNHQVMLSGESQGAWIAGEVTAFAEYKDVIKRVLLMGHPWLAAHQYVDGQDPRVKVINHKGDQVTLPVKGDPAVGLDAMIAIRTLKIAQLGTVIKALAANPMHGVMMLKTIVNIIPGAKSIIKDPHDYRGEMTAAVEYLRNGSARPDFRFTPAHAARALRAGRASALMAA